MKKDMCRTVRSMPHACGDEPNNVLLKSSLSFVCPTHVGMNRRVRDGVSGLATRMPHISDGLLSGR